MSSFILLSAPFCDDSVKSRPLRVSDRGRVIVLVPGCHKHRTRRQRKCEPNR